MASKLYPSVRPKAHDVNGEQIALTQQEARNVLSNIKTFTNHGKHKQASDLYNKYFKVGPKKHI